MESESDVSYNSDTSDSSEDIEDEDDVKGGDRYYTKKGKLMHPEKMGIGGWIYNIIGYLVDDQYIANKFIIDEDRNIYIFSLNSSTGFFKKGKFKTYLKTKYKLAYVNDITIKSSEISKIFIRGEGKFVHLLIENKKKIDGLWSYKFFGENYETITSVDRIINMETERLEYDIAISTLITEEKEIMTEKNGDPGFYWKYLDEPESKLRRISDRNPVPIP